MCGIAGIRRFDDRPVDEGALRAMMRVLHHRGPDDEDLWVEGPVGIAHTRLSIIDLGGSRQPMTSDDGRHVLTFNGEIFNYQQLREQLDYPFVTRGDTEVVLATMVRHGAHAASDLLGQFAFAVHDRASGATSLVRDRLGVLPLYYYLDEHQLVFASEPKAILAVLGERARLDREQLRTYLRARAVHAPATLFEGIRKVPPGHVVTVSATGRATVAPYWTLPSPDEVEHGTPEEAVDRVEAALRDAIDASLVADVPVGAYLSGGVDSSLIVALAAAARREAGSTTPVATFAAEFGDPRVDETAHSELVSRTVGTDHHRVLIRPDDFRETWQHLTWHRDAPVSEPADIAVAQLATAARQHVKVVLSGEGSDELFGGYPKYRFAHATALAGRLPASARAAALRRLERALPASRGKARIGLRSLGGARMEDWFAPFTVHEVDALLGTTTSRPPRVLPHRDAIDLMARTDLDTWLPDNLLERGDRMSMAASLELRPPFLDHRLVELAFRLPSSVKVRDGQTKWVVKQVARRHLPEQIVSRPKVGFRVPLDAWFRGELESMARDLLQGTESFVGGVLDTRAVGDILDDHTRGRRDEEIRIWTLLSLEMWGRTFLADPALAAS
ncbi:asparagine synthase (glutamine-hydrolyzing) [Nocardioides currus]|uniref:asparagine synthase (glutamine-hydrolyzing) n=1 Tax=Nocardioides currus TaxID=2133958 RepID=A0A2R7Z140_9ACTN|nr:asparagine synthase (glutamine-hydrolyzing) [Nocardioides currus]PUA82351.1 asparagine synthase (glutamine-hydrolyzing) [Nocardioides currus]